MIKAVIFDLDGTLVTFNLDVRACRTEAINYLAEQGFPRNLFSMNETAFDMLVKAKQYLKTEKDCVKEFAQIEKQVFLIVESYELEAAKTNQLFSGVPETLRALKEMKLKLGLCTISGEKATNYVLNKFSLFHFFDAIVTRESVPAVKPHPAHLEATLDALDVSADEALLVGDSVKDVACADQLKVLAVGVTTGLSTAEKLAQSGANYVASSVNEIPFLVKQINKED